MEDNGVRMHWSGEAGIIAYMRSCFDLLETTLLADGRNWILKTDKPPWLISKVSCPKIRSLKAPR